MGFVPMKKSEEKTTRAIKKFIITPAEIMMSFFRSFAFTKLLASVFSAEFVPSSPLSATNPPSGIRFNVYFVPDLSVRSVAILGGIPNQNSFTWTQDFLAAMKCPSSCKITSKTKVSIQSIIQSIKVFFKKIKNLSETICNPFQKTSKKIKGGFYSLRMPSKRFFNCGFVLDFSIKSVFICSSITKSEIRLMRRSFAWM